MTHGPSNVKWGLLMFYTLLASHPLLVCILFIYNYLCSLYILIYILL